MLSPSSNILFTGKQVDPSTICGEFGGKDIGDHIAIRFRSRSSSSVFLNIRRKSLLSLF